MTMRTKTVTYACIMGFVICSSTIRADMGAIPFRPFTPIYKYVDVFEPDQRALIAWNGKEEILILSTDLHASEDTNVLEVIPMPSEPNVVQGNMKVFKAAVDLLNSKLPKKAVVVGGSGGGGVFGIGDGSEAKTIETPPVAEITFHEKIGATDVAVVHVLNQKGFIEWVEKYLKTQNVVAPVIPDIMKKTVQEYLDDGYEWFSFNVVSLTKNPQSKQAMRYRFKTDSLFYPMRISRTDKGETHVSLTVLTNEPFDSLAVTGAPEGWLSLAYNVVTVTGMEIEKVNRECYVMLGRPSSSRLRVWETKGKLQSFDQDIVGGQERTFTLQHEKNGKTFGPYPLRRNCKIQMGMEVFTLLVVQEFGGMPMQFALRRETNIVKNSSKFSFTQGTKVELAGEPFILKLGKLPIAKDPSKPVNSKVASSRPAETP